jgi:methylmalonyl-CoA mutase N-terminal domain/subunit
VNFLHREEEERSIEMFRLDADAEKRQVEALRRLRSERDAKRVEECLARVEEAARGDTNLVPPILEAVKVLATQGEICDALRNVFGVHRPDSLTSGV